MVEAGVLTLQGVVQHYDWGGYHFIPDLLEMENANRKPFAELWIGAHAKAPSIVELADGPEPLDELIAEAPMPSWGRRRMHISLAGCLISLRLSTPARCFPFRRTLRWPKPAWALRAKTPKASASRPAAGTTKTITTSQKSALR